jgi:hypothetical protein
MIMRARIIFFISLFACAPEKGTVAIELQWEGGRPTFEHSPYLYLHVDDGDRRLRTEGPAVFDAELELDLRAIPNGEDRVLIAEVREAPWANALLLYRGASAPFAIEPDQNLELVVVLQRADTPQAETGPPVPDASKLLYRRRPWGSTAGAAGHAFVLEGSEGAVAANISVLVFDRRDVSRATELGRTVAGERGEFILPLMVSRTEVPELYAASADARGALSDSSTVAGLQAELVHRGEWSATLLGKIRGRNFPNPHRVVATPWSERSLVQRAEVTTELEQEAIDVLATSAGAHARVTSSEIWRRATPPRYPEERFGAAMTFDRARGRGILFGGSGADFIDHDDLWEWDGRGWTRIEPLGARPPPRLAHSFVHHEAKGRTILFGGSNEVNGALWRGDLWEWDSSAWTRRTFENGPGARYGHAATYDSRRGRMIIFGGCIEGDFDCRTPSPELWEWDGDRWYLAAEGPSGRVEAALVYDSARDRTILFGGVGENGELPNDVWEWDGDRWEQKATDDGPRGRRAPGGVFDEIVGEAVFAGGSPVDLSLPAIRETWAWNGSEWRKYPPANEFYPSLFFSMFFDATRGETILLPGISAGGGTWILRGEQWVHRAPARSGPSPRNGASLSYQSATGSSLMFGGRTDSLQLSDETWEWTAGAWTRVNFGRPSPPPRRGAAIAHDALRGETVIYGGVDEDGDEFGDTWIWSASGWRPRRTAATTGPRMFASMAFDETRGQIVLFGGSIDPNTWLWNGETETWTSIAPTGPAPEIRLGAAMAYDPIAGRVVLFGGFGLDSTLQDTWSWNGSAWELLASEGPPARGLHTLVFDEQFGRMTVFGGVLDNDTLVQDVWILEGNSWREVRTPAVRPSVRAGQAGTYDSQRRRMLIFGGEDEDERLGDTWEWDGEIWREHKEELAPAPRSRFGLAFVEGRERVALFGGCTNFACISPLPDLWEWDGFQWAQRDSLVPIGPRAEHAFSTGLDDGTFASYGGFDGFGSLNGMYIYNGLSWDLFGVVQNLGIGVGATLMRDVANQQMLLFGGRTSRALTLGTYTWRQFGPFDRRTGLAVEPPGRVYHTMSYDEGRELGVLFGGADGPSGDSAAPLGDTWLWTGSEWSEVSGPAPPPRWGHATAYDDRRGRTLLFGGRHEFGFDDLWAFDGERWRELEVAGPRPPQTHWHRTAFDRARGELVLFGGEAEDGPLGDTWLLPSDPEQRPAAIFSVDWTAAGAGAEQIESIEIMLGAGARGFTTELALAEPGAPVAGASLEIWDAFSGRWSPLTTNMSDLDEPTALTAELTDAGRRYVTGDGAIHFRVTPALSVGSGPEPAAIALDGFELTVSYNLRKTISSSAGN